MINRLNCFEWTTADILSHIYYYFGYILNYKSKRPLRPLFILIYYVIWLMGAMNEQCFDFRNANFPCICSSIPESSAHVPICKIYATAFYSYGDFIYTGRLLTNKLVDQGYMLDKLNIYISFMVHTMIYYNITILPLHIFCVTLSTADVFYIYWI